MASYASEKDRLCKMNAVGSSSSSNDKSRRENDYSHNKIQMLLRFSNSLKGKREHVEVEVDRTGAHAE